MSFFNKNLLLESQDNLELFKLHLPNPQKLIKNIIDNDDVEMLIQIENEITLIAESCLSNRILRQIFEEKNKDISQFILNNILQKGKIPIKIIVYYLYESAWIANIYKYLIIHKEIFTKDQIECFTYAIYKMINNGKYNYKSDNILFTYYPIIKISKKNIHIIENIEKSINNIFPITMKILISLDKISNETIYKEYITWIIEMLKYIPYFIYENKNILFNNVRKKLNLINNLINDKLDILVNKHQTFYYNLNYLDRHNFIKNIKIINIINIIKSQERN